MKNHKFLIVVSGWNCQDLVRNCLQSIDDQTYKNYDVVIVNDASIDNTLLSIIGLIEP